LDFGRDDVHSKREQQILDDIKARLNPPTQEEIDRATAKWLFGENAERMMKYAPWSFVLTKLMWKKGEEPWER
jgi:hypothetical protein